MRTILCTVLLITGCAAERGYGPPAQGPNGPNGPPSGQGMPMPNQAAPQAPNGAPALTGSGPQADGTQVDQRAVALLSDFLAALQRNSGDLDAAARAASPYLHKSLLRPGNPSDVNDDLKRFSFKKAWQNAGFYANPVNITRVRRNQVTAIGAGDTGEAGYVVDYFVGKLNPQAGMPAPVSVFFPNGGGAPKISYVGSL